MWIADFCWAPYIYHQSGNVISATVGFVNIYLQPEYEFSSSTRFGQFQKLGKFEFGALSSPAASPMEKYVQVTVLFRSYLRVRIDLPSSINLRDINGFPKL